MFGVAPAATPSVTPSVAVRPPKRFTSPSRCRRSVIAAAPSEHRRESAGQEQHDGEQHGAEGLEGVGCGDERVGVAGLHRRDVEGSGGVASPSVKANLAKETYKASDHWLPQGCVSSSPYVDCTWTNDAGKTVVFTYDPPFAWVVGYSGTYFA